MLCRDEMREGFVAYKIIITGFASFHKFPIDKCLVNSSVSDHLAKLSQSVYCICSAGMTMNNDS